MSKALLVIDMTEYFLEDKVRDDRVKKVSNIKSVIEKCVECNLPVFFFEYFFQDVYRTGINSATNNVMINSWTYSTINELRDLVDGYEPACFFKKRHYDCFLCSSFKKKLSECDLEELLVAGCNAEVCIKHTIRRALDENFKVLTGEPVLLSINSEPEKMSESIRYFKDKGALVASQVKELIKDLNY